MTVRLTISQMHAHTDAIGSSGTSGARKARGRFGRVRRKMMTPPDTSRNANRVPTFTISSSLSAGTLPHSAFGFVVYVFAARAAVRPPSRGRAVAGQHLLAQPRLHVDLRDVAAVVRQHPVIHQSAPQR